MELVTITDEENNKYCFKRYNGFPFFKEVTGSNALREVSRLSCYPDDVLVCVFPKSGTHLLYNTVMMLRTGTLMYHGTPDLMGFIQLDKITSMPSPRTFGTHLRFRFLPEEMKLGKGKIVTITRNPKDVIVSLWHMMQVVGDIGYTGTFDGFLKKFFSEENMFGNGSWFAWMKDMEDWKSNNLLCLSYEDFTQNTFENIVKLAKFLEVDHDETFLREVEKNIRFDKLRESHNNLTPTSDRWKHLVEGGRLPIYRKGRVGEWKNTFTVAQNELYDKHIKEKVTEFGLKLDLIYE